MLKKYKVILILTLIILLISVSSKVNAASKIYKVKWESVLADGSGNNIDIVPADTYVKVESGGTDYWKIGYKVEYTSGEIRYRTGYIKKSVLKATSSEKISITTKNAKKNRIIENKIEIVNLAYKIYNQNVKYNQNQRVNFYKNYKKTNATDCSSLCSTIYNRVLGFNMYRDNAKTNIWLAADFVKNTNSQMVKVDTGEKINKRFNFVKNITDGKGELASSKMQIGDCIVIGKKNKSGYEHIAMYIGNGKIIEAIQSDGGNSKEYNKVIIRTIPKYYYSATNGSGSGEWYKIAQIRPFSKYMAQE